MSIHAVAVVRIPTTRFAERLAAKPMPDRVGVLKATGASGESFSLEALDDGALVFTPADFGAEPQDLSRAINALLGDVLAAHDDARGIFVYPAKARARARTYEAVIDEIGELGSWIPRSAPVAAARTAPARTAMPDASALGAMLPPGFEDQMRGFMAAIPPDAMAAMQQAMMSGDPSAMEAVQRQLEQALGGADALAQLQNSLAGVLEQFGGDGDGELSPDALMAQARAELESLRETDPVQYEALRKQLGITDADAPPPVKKP